MTTSRFERTCTLLSIIAMVAAVAVGCSGTSAGPGVSAAASLSAAPIPVAIPEAIVGTWTTTITAADLKAAGLPEAALAENAGVFTMTLGQDGTWTSSQEANVPLRWPIFRGSYIATGPNSFRQTTEFPADYAGDVVDFTWAVEGGALVLKLPAPPDPVLPVVVETHPWQRQP